MLTNLISWFIGAILTVIFVIIPTSISNPHKLIELIEADHKIEIKDYSVITMYEDFLGFDTTQELTIKLSSNQTETIISKFSNDPNYSRVDRENEVEFMFHNVNGRSFETFTFNSDEETLHYKYSGD